MNTANLQVPAPSGDVGKVFATYPAPARKLLLAIRAIGTSACAMCTAPTTMRRSGGLWMATKVSPSSSKPERSMRNRASCPSRSSRRRTSRRLP